jgi:hypothetical protein
VGFILASSLTTKTSELLETCEVLYDDKTCASFTPNSLLNVKFYKHVESAKNSENVTNLSTHLVQVEIVRIIITLNLAFNTNCKMLINIP